MEIEAKIEAPAGSCFTCFRHAETYKPILGSLNVAEVLTQHFWFQLGDFKAQHRLCLRCWNHLETFHEFYQEVKQNHFGYALDPNCVIKQEDVTDSSSVENEEEQAPQLTVEAFSIEPEIKEEPGDETENDVEEEDEELDPSYGVEIEEYVLKHTVKRKYNKKRQKQDEAVRKRRAKPIIKSAEEIAQEDAIIRTHVPYICEVCNGIFESFTTIVKHMESVHNVVGAVTCCGRRYHRRIDLLDHVQGLNNPGMFKCDICQKSFVNNYAVLRHKQSVHVPDEEKPYRCERCPSRFVLPGLLKFHMRGHENIDNKALKCPHCERIFKAESILKAHIKRRHTRPTDFVCDVCAKGFFSKADFMRHKMEHEAPDKVPRFQCDICNQSLKTREGLTKHILRHTAKPMACDQCEHVARNKSALAVHKWYRHNRVQNESHPCKLCGKTFKRAIGLKEHMASHTGEKLYSCMFCDKQCNSNAAMYVHRKKMHLQEWLEYKKAKQEAQNKRLDTVKQGEAT